MARATGKAVGVGEEELTMMPPPTPLTNTCPNILPNLAATLFITIF